MPTVNQYTVRGELATENGAMIGQVTIVEVAFGEEAKFCNFLMQDADFGGRGDPIAASQLLTLTLTGGRKAKVMVSDFNPDIGSGFSVAGTGVFDREG